MRRSWIAMATAALILVACNRQPSNILPIDKMARVMWDVIQADEFVTGYVSRDSSKNEKVERMKLYQKVFALHKVSEKDYYDSFKFYAGKPGKYRTLMDTLSNRALREQRSYQAVRTVDTPMKRTIERKKPDTTRKAHK